MRAWGAVLLAGLYVGASAVEADTLPLPDTLIALQSKEGAELLFGAEARGDYPVLSAHFTTQINPAFCGPASMAMILNALGLPRPTSDATMGLGMFDQDNVFTREVEEVKTRTDVEETGMTLHEFSDALETYGLDVTVIEAGDTDLASFRDTAIKVLNDDTNFLLVNYLRSALGQKEGGHISPVAAYDADTDRFLVLDVSRYKYPPVWVEASVLFDAMDTGGDGWTRGYVVVGK